MTALPSRAPSVEAVVLTVLAYVLAHGLTAFLVTPLQARILPEVTVFASLVYLPHGVRVLATWLMGWRAFFALFVASYLAHILFTPQTDRTFLQPLLWESLAVGAGSALLAFGLLRLIGFEAPCRHGRKMRWVFLLTVGALSSVLNSVGQTLVYSGLTVPTGTWTVLAVYAVGDMIGLSVCMVVLMFAFRWMRLGAKPG